MASISLLTSPPWLSSRPTQHLRVQSASFSLLAGKSSVSMNAAPTTSSTGRPALLHSSFLASSSFTSSFSGQSLGLDVNSNYGVSKGRGFRLVVRAGKAALCQTKRNRSRKSLARTHGFRRRMRTTSGRALLKRRRAKGRWVLCPKTNPSSGKRNL